MSETNGNGKNSKALQIISIVVTVTIALGGWGLWGRSQLTKYETMADARAEFANNKVIDEKFKNLENQIAELKDDIRELKEIVQHGHDGKIR